MRLLRDHLAEHLGIQMVQADLLSKSFKQIPGQMIADRCERDSMKPPQPAKVDPDKRRAEQYWLRPFFMSANSQSSPPATCHLLIT